ncbi:MAG: hypothetical protein ABWU11_24750, partial [Arthrospira platensis]
AIAFSALVSWIKLTIALIRTYDGNWTYWATRKGQAIDTPKRVAKLLKKQKGRCAWCGQYFTPSPPLRNLVTEDL